MLFIYLVVSFLNLGLFVYFLFRKGEQHFQLLRIIYPDKLKDVHSFHQMNNSLKVFDLPFKDILWLYSPIYFYRSNIGDLEGEKLKKHENLMNSNVHLTATFVFFVLWIFVVSYLMGLWEPTGLN